MSKRIVILASVFLTTVILVIIGAVSTAVFAQKTPTQSVDPQIIDEYRLREQEYNQALEQANQQLEQANQQLQELQAQQTAQINPAAKPTLSVADAETIAAAAAESEITSPNSSELVDYEGRLAYEVVFEKGSVYVDAQSGEVLLNGTVSLQIGLDDAQKIAVDYMKLSDVLQVDEVTINRMPLYRVIFQVGHMVYIDQNGQILFVQMAGSGQGLETTINGSSNSSGGNYKDDDHDEDEHEDRDEDEHEQEDD